ncbi:hypothetical protein B0H16DRAFT_1472393 [Mycena metata]|uniref:Uncharacterized protein n=1 Tax=Mycena metata TaxID=1033252 RepID=A0AAD7HPL8_9AGAR|nr:hypothetical protein B0H16DRAFT_1472393 [Mycena metata]
MRALTFIHPGRSYARRRGYSWRAAADVPTSHGHDGADGGRVHEHWLANVVEVMLGTSTAALPYPASAISTAIRRTRWHGCFTPNVFTDTAFLPAFHPTGAFEGDEAGVLRLWSYTRFDGAHRWRSRARRNRPPQEEERNTKLPPSDSMGLFAPARAPIAAVSLERLHYTKMRGRSDEIVFGAQRMKIATVGSQARRILGALETPTGHRRYSVARRGRVGAIGYPHEQGSGMREWADVEMVVRDADIHISVAFRRPPGYSYLDHMFPCYARSWESAAIGAVASNQQPATGEDRAHEARARRDVDGPGWYWRGGWRDRSGQGLGGQLILCRKIMMVRPLPQSLLHLFTGTNSSLPFGTWVKPVGDWAPSCTVRRIDHPEVARRQGRIRTAMGRWKGSDQGVWFFNRFILNR